MKNLMIVFALLLFGCGSSVSEPAALQMGGNYLATMTRHDEVNGLPTFDAEWLTQPIWISQAGRSVVVQGYPGWVEGNVVVFEVEFTDYSMGEHFDREFKVHLTGEGNSALITIRIEQIVIEHSTQTVLEKRSSTFAFSDLTPGTFTHGH